MVSDRVTVKDLLETVMDLVDEIKLAVLQVKMLRCDCTTFLDLCFYSGDLLVKTRFSLLASMCTFS